MTRARAALVDRDPQNLPLPLGGMAPVRAQRPRRHRSMRRHIPALLHFLGGVAAVLGVLLLLTPPPVAVSLVGDQLQVGATVLTAAGGDGAPDAVRYTGDASYVLHEPGDGSASASAAWTSNGTTSWGACALRPQGTRLVDECTFVSGSYRLTSVDVLDPAAGPAWQRTYADGTRVTIAVAADGAAVPVPFPIGH